MDVCPNRHSDGLEEHEDPALVLTAELRARGAALLPVAEALARMRHHKVHRFPVVDNKGKLVGIVSHSDLLYAAPSSATSPVRPPAT